MLQRTFGTLHWKLTATYVLVSLLLATTLITALVGALLWLLSSNLLLDEFWNGTRSLAITLAPEFAEPNRTPESLGEQLRVIVVQNNQLLEPAAEAPAGGTAGEPGLVVDIPPGTYFVALLDDTGRVITSTAPLEYPTGTLITEREPSATHPLIDAALRGVEEPRQLSLWLEPGHEPVTVAPVMRQGVVLGAVYTRYNGVPSPAVVLTELPSFLVGFMVPWLLTSMVVGLLYAWMAGRGISRRVKRLAEASAALANGDLSRRVEDRAADEIGQLSRQFNAMAEQLEEHVRALRLLADRNAQLAEQAAQLATVEERNRLARDLHDSVSQELFSLTMLAAAARRTIDRSPAQAADQLIEISAGAQRALHETRGLIFALRPAALDDRGLAPALRDLASALRERQGVAVELTISGERRLPLEHEQALFRIVQEALANAVRHGHVSQAAVELRYAERQVQLSVSDCGRGFDPSAPRSPRSVGLLSMAERAQALGGSWSIESAPGRGTTVGVVLPTP
jgi:signal transduction histidine kinase